MLERDPNRALALGVVHHAERSTCRASPCRASARWPTSSGAPASTARATTCGSSQEQIRYWKIESLTGLNELGRKAQEKILGIPARLRRIADIMETRSRAKTFSFEVVFNREFAME